MRHRNVYVNSLAKLLELGVLMNTPIKQEEAKPPIQRDASIPSLFILGSVGITC